MTYRIDLMETKRILAENIVDYMNLHGLSPEHIAAKCTVSRQYIYDIIKLTSNPTLDKVDEIARAMGCSFKEITTKNYFKGFQTKITKRGKL